MARWIPEPATLIPFPTRETIPNGISYKKWSELWGQSRWYRKDGSARVFVALDYEWEAIYKMVTEMADGVFSTRKVTDIPYFTNHFLATVPTAWLKFKTSLEMYLGTLNGTNINPEEFHAGFTRELKEEGSRTENRDLGHQEESSMNSTYSNTQSGTNENSTDPATDKNRARNVVYNQGVQAYGEKLKDENIGTLGGDYASGFTDSTAISDIGKRGSSGSTSATGSGKNDAKQTGAYKDNEKTTGNDARIINEKVTRINYYDQLAFMRERMDRLDIMDNFIKHFENLFMDINICRTCW